MPPKMDKTVVNGKDITGMPHVKLLSFAQQVYDTLMLERRERSEAQLFCDYTKTAWDEARSKLKESKKERLVKALFLERRQEDVKVPVKEKDQARKFYIYDLELFRKDMEGRIRKEVAEHEIQWEEEFLEERLRKKTKLKQEKHQLLEKLPEELDELIEKQKVSLEEFQQKLDDLSDVRDKKMYDRMDRIEKEFSTRHQMEVVMTNEMYNDTINKIKENHREVFGKVKSFYKETTENDLLLIDSLSLEYANLLEEIKKKQTQIKKMAEDNEKLIIPLNKAKKDFIRMDLKLNNFQKDMRGMKVATRRMQNLTYEIKKNHKMISEYEKKLTQLRVKKQNFETYVESILATEKKHRGLLEEKLRAAFDLYTKYKERTDKIIDAYRETVGADQFNKAVLKIAEKPTREDDALRNYHFQALKYSKAHNDTIKVFSAKLKDVGTRCHNNFPPIVNIEYSKKPAALVTRSY